MEDALGAMAHRATGFWIKQVAAEQSRVGDTLHDMQNAMRIGIYTEDVPASVGGGYVLRDDLAAAAAQSGGPHRFELIHVPRSVQFRSRILKKAGRFLGRPDHAVTPVGNFLRREVARRKFDLVWFNHFEPVYIGVPYVLGIFDLQHRLQPWFPEISSNREWEQRERWGEAVRRASVVTVGSPEAREQLCHFYGVPLENVRVIPFPTPQHAINAASSPTQAPQPDIKSKYGIKTPFLFYPAQFWPHKNHVNLLLALKLLQAHGRNISLVLTGSDHGNEQYIRKVAQDNGLQDCVHFCGFVPYEDILAFYRQALALSYVSLFGPENLPPLEAMALGCPVVLSDVPGAQHLHGDIPFMVDPRDPQSIAAAVDALMTQSDHKDRISAGKSFAVRNDCARYMTAFQAILDEFAPIRRCWP